MYCDIKGTKYGNKLAEQIGEKNAKQFGMALDTPRWQKWFGKGKTVALENGATVPFINPLMQVINGEGQTFNLLERFKWTSVKEAENFFSTVEGVSLKDGVFTIDNSYDRIIVLKLLQEVDRLYPKLLNRKGDTFSVNPIFDDVHYSKESVKDGVDFVFGKNPELSSIGSKEDYSAYLDTIFPNSKVKDIQYHGTFAKFETFDTKRGNKKSMTGFGSMFGSKLAAEIRIGDQFEIAEEDETPTLHAVILDMQNPAIGDYDEILKDALAGKLNDNDSFILEQTDTTAKSIARRGQHEEERYIELKTEYLVKEPNQIHILGSKKDVEGFRNWKNGTTDSLEEDVLVAEALSYSHRIKGFYKEIFHQNPRQALFEVAVQYNSGGGDRDGAISTFGKKIVEIARKLFPDAKVGDKFENYLKQKANGESAEFNEKIVSLLDKLSIRFGIPYRLVNDPQADFKGYYSNGTIIINVAHVTKDTPFHEFLHPFILVLEKQNPGLYKTLVEELKTTEEGIKTLAEVARLYPELSPEDRIHEAVVTYLGRLAAKKWDVKGSGFNRFKSWLKALLKKLGIVSSKEFKTLNDLAEAIVDETYVQNLKQEITNGDTIVRYSKNDTDLSYEAVFDRIKDKISILNAMLKRRSKGDTFSQDVAALKEIFEHSDEVVSVNNFVANAFEYVDKAREKFETLRAGVQDPSKLTQLDISNNMYVLAEIQQLLNVYQSLDDIQDLYFREGRLSTDDTMAKLAETILKKRQVVQDFKSFALTYVTEWLFPYIERTNNMMRAENKMEFVVTKDMFRDQLKTAMKDISAAGFWLGSTINSQDPVSAAVALALKDIVYENHQKDINTARTLVEEYEKQRDVAVYATDKSEDEWNMQFLRYVDNWEQIGVDENGKAKMGFVQRLAFHTEYLDDQFEKDRKALYNDEGAKAARNSDEYKTWSKKRKQWYNQHTRVNPDAASIIAKKKKELTNRQFHEWLLRNSREVEEEVYDNGMKKSEMYYADRLINYNSKRGTFRVYAGELMLPSERYKNLEFQRLMQNPYYAKLYNTYKEANDKLGNHALRFGIIPQVSKGKNAFSQIEWRQHKTVGAKLKALKEAMIKGVIDDTDDSQTIERIDGSQVKRVPVRFVAKLEERDLSKNLLQSVLKFSQMSNNHESMDEIESNVLILKTVLNGDSNLRIKGREVNKTNAKGVQVINRITQKLVPKASRDGMVNKRLNEFIDDIVYGDEEIKEVYNLPLIGEVNMNRLSDNVAFLTALQNMALNFNGGLSNIIIGNFNNSIEAVGGRFYGKKNWMWAQKEYWANLPNFLGELVGQTHSPLNFFADHYDVPQGEFRDQFGNKLTGGAARKAMKTSSLFFIQAGGEHQIQLTGMLSLMDATKVKTLNGEEKTLYEAWRSFGTLEAVVANTDWTVEKDVMFRNRLHAITKNLQGIYNKFDKSMLQRRWLGRLAIMFRKYLFSSIKARYGGKYVDYELGTVQEGYWNSAWSKLKQEMIDYKWHMVTRMWTKEGYTPEEKAAVNKTLFEFGVMMAAILLTGLAQSMDEDEDGWLANFVALQIVRFNADIKQFINPADFIRVIRNPAASLNMIEKWIEWMMQLGHPLEEYERKSGWAEKGDNKLWIKTQKLTPVIRQIVNVMTPEEQIKFYNLRSSTAK
jgi:hypothetical protein